MTIIWPITLPTDGIAKESPAPATKVAALTSEFTFATQVQQHAGYRWVFNIALTPGLKVGDGVYEQWHAALLQLNGQAGTCYYGPGYRSTARGIATGTPRVKGARQTGSELITDGWTISQTGIMKQMDFFTLGTGTSTRLHTVTVNANSNGSGDATLDIWPPLRESPANNAALDVSAPKGVFRLASNVMAANIDQALFMGMSFTLVEALNI